MAVTGASSVEPRDAPMRGPATKAMSAARAINATAQGSGSRPRAVRGASGWAPAGVPQRWQNFAPGVSDERHPAQAAPESEAPQEAQNCPDADEPHAGQVIVGLTAAGMRENYT